MKVKWLMLLAMSIPLMTLGDLPRTTEIHHLRRIGDNIDVVSGNVHNDCMDLLIPVLLMFLGLCILVVFNRWKKLRPAIEGAGKKFVINIIKFTVWCVVLVALCRFAEEIDFAFPDNEGVILGVFLFAMVWGLVDVFGRRWSIIIMCSVIIGGLWVVLNIPGFSHFLLQAMLDEGRTIYVAEPGWHYPDKVPDSDRKLQHCVNMDDVKGVKRLLEENAKELKDTKISFESIFDGFSGSADEMAIVRLLDEKGFKLPFRDVELAKVFSRKSITDSTVTNAVGYLIDKGADVNEVDFFGNTLLANLCDDNRHKKDLVQVVRFLLEKGADPNLGKKPPLLALTESHRYSPYAKETIKLLLEKGANVNVEDSFFNRTPLENAVKGIRDIELVKLLVEHGATITDEIIKRARRRSEVQKYLLEKSGKTEADIYPQRGSKAKFDGAPENKIDGKCSGVHSFFN